MADKISALIFSDRKVLVNGIRQAITGLKFIGDKTFTKSKKEAQQFLEGQTSAIVIVDWDVGPSLVLKFMKSIEKIPVRDSLILFLTASEQSEKIIAAAAEMGFSKVHTGPITAVKIRLALEELAEKVYEVSPIRDKMKKVSEARLADDWDTATEILEELYARDKENKRVLYELAENYIHDSQWKKGYKLLVKHVDVDAPDVRVLHALGKCLLKMGETEKAVKVFEKANLLNPFNTQRLIDLGNVLIEVDRVTEAEENFDKALQLDDENLSAIKGKGTCKLLDGDVNAALTLLRDQVSGRELASVFNTAAITSMRLGRFPKGMSLYEAAEKVLQSQTLVLARVLFNKGIGYYKWKKMPEAKTCFERSVKLDPKFEAAVFNLKAISNAQPVPSKPIAAEDPDFEAKDSDLMNVDEAGGESDSADGLDDDLFSSLFEDVG